MRDIRFLIDGTGSMATDARCGPAFDAAVEVLRCATEFNKNLTTQRRHVNVDAMIWADVCLEVDLKDQRKLHDLRRGIGGSSSGLPRALGALNSVSAENFQHLIIISDGIQAEADETLRRTSEFLSAHPKSRIDLVLIDSPGDPIVSIFEHPKCHLHHVQFAQELPALVKQLVSKDMFKVSVALSKDLRTRKIFKSNLPVPKI